MDLRLAPMAGVTNAPFRLVCREAGAGLLTSEEIDARALVEGNARTQVIEVRLGGLERERANRGVARRSISRDCHVVLLGWDVG